MNRIKYAIVAFALALSIGCSSDQPDLGVPNDQRIVTHLGDTGRIVLINPDGK